MSVLVVGISHKSAPVDLLERVALDGDGAAKLAREVSTCEHVTEAAVISTCNRLEVYAEVDRFHGSVEDVSRLLLQGADSIESLMPHLYVHYEDGAVAHLFQVVAGLDSMAVGEAQILGQARTALAKAQDLGTAGPALNSLFQQALRVGKRAHAETGIDRVAPSLVSTALARAEHTIGSVAGVHALVVGAGSMAALAVATLAREGAMRIVIVNRTAERAHSLAAEYAADVASIDQVAALIPGMDLVLAATGASGMVLESDVFTARDRPLAVVDLALPRDVDPSVGALAGIDLITLADLADNLHDSVAGDELEAVRAIVTDEITAFLSARRQASVTPTVVALRTMATGVVEAEMSRLAGRLPDLDEADRAEVLQSMRRVADKLVHQPTLRVKELANETGAVSYAAALADLFALDPDSVDAVTNPVVDEGRS